MDVLNTQALDVPAESSFLDLKKSEFLKQQRQRFVQRHSAMELTENVLYVIYKNVTYHNAYIQVKDGILQIKQGRRRPLIILLQLENGYIPGEAVPAGARFEVNPVDPLLGISVTIAFATLEEANRFVQFCESMTRHIAEMLELSDDSGGSSS